MKTYIEFKKQRQLGDIISDTFNFIRNELKPFFRTVLQIVGPYLIVFLIAISLYGYASYSTFGQFISEFSYTTDVGMNNFTGVNIALFIAGIILLIFSVIAIYTLSHAATLYYIESYADNEGKVDYEVVKDKSKNKFWSFIGLGILVGLMVGFGFVLCIVPGIYVYVPLSLTYAIMVFRNTSVDDAISASFKLVKNEWWITFATLLVIGILVGIAGSAFGVPAAIYQWVKMGIIPGAMDLNEPAEIFVDPIYWMLNLLSYAFQYLLNFVTIIASAFIYFNLNERKNFTGTFETINNIGTQSED